MISSWVRLPLIRENKCTLCFWKYRFLFLQFDSQFLYVHLTLIWNCFVFQLLRMKSVLLKQKQSRLKWSKENESPYIHCCISSFYGDDYALVCGNSVVKVVLWYLDWNMPNRRLKRNKLTWRRQSKDIRKTRVLMMMYRKTWKLLR